MGINKKYTNKEWAYFQCSRYWVERCFDDCKNVGMSGYQVTGWLAWQHHLVMMASLYILTLKLENQDEIPHLRMRIASYSYGICHKKRLDLAWNTFE